MEQVYFLFLIAQLREMDMGVSEALGDEIARIREHRTKRRKIYLSIQEEMEERWAANIERNKRFMRCGERCVQELKDRDHRTLYSGHFRETIHPGRCILPRGERRTPGYNPGYEIYHIIGQKFDTPNIYIGGHLLSVQRRGYIHRREEIKVSGGLVMWKGILGHSFGGGGDETHERIYEIMNELEFTGYDNWTCSYGSDEKKVEQWKRIYNYLLEKDK